MEDKIIPIDKLRIGQRVIATEGVDDFHNDHTTVPIGTRGTIVRVGSRKSIQIDWDNGYSYDLYYYPSDITELKVFRLDTLSGWMGMWKIKRQGN